MVFVGAREVLPGSLMKDNEEITTSDVAAYSKFSLSR
jgi:hypothetical protein